MPDIVGTDGIAPSFNPSGRWTIWELSEVYMGGPGNNMYVPKVNDYVIQSTSGTLYIVTNLNLTNYIPTLQQIEISKLPAVLNYSNILGDPSVEDVLSPYKLYFNSETNPYTLNVDASLIIFNTLANSVKFILGSNVTNNPTTISLSLDNNGNIVSDSIPLVGVSYNDTANVYNKVIPTAFTNQILQTGDLVTALIYDAVGNVIQQAVLTVVETNGYVGPSDPTLLVTGLSLESPFISTTNPNVIELPANIGISNVQFKGVVNYNNGTTAIHNVNQGGPFRVYGLDQVLKANMLESVDIVLQYTLQPEEKAIVGQSYNGKTVSENYTLRLTSPNFDYQLQLYPIPVYNGTSFNIHWFLLSMSRNIFIEVTQYVTYSNGSGFNGSLYGTNQSLQVSLNLNNVVPQLTGLNVNQYCELLLNNVSLGPSTIYQIYTDTAISTAPYGNNVRAKSLNSNNSILDITCQNQQTQYWLDQVYYANLPVTNTQLESAPPVPTHFDIFYNTSPLANNQLITNGAFKRFQLGQWNESINLGNVTLPLNSTIMIRFLQITANQVAVLSVSPMLVTKY
jgi:hypothetical protein